MMVRPWMRAADPLTGWELTRRWMMRTLLPSADLCGVLPLVGTHYEVGRCRLTLSNLR
jgi:hypothetical protein